MRVFLDDARDAPPGWVRTYTPDETIAVLATGKVTELSLDYDLGLDTPEAERTGYTVLAWLEREIGEGRWQFPLPRFAIHSANPPGRLRMQRAIESIERLADRG